MECQSKLSKSLTDLAIWVYDEARFGSMDKAVKLQKIYDSMLRKKEAAQCK